MILYSNNATTTLASGISDSATTITVATGTGSLFPDISSVDDYFNVTITDSAKHIEIVTVTARTGDTFTVMRGMENTTARAWLASDILELRITKGLLDQLKLDATKDTASNLSAHTSNTSNPHSVTATQVGLGNVTNESKDTMFTSPTFTGTVSGVTASMVGLGNVDNKSSATIRSEITSSNVTTALGYTPYNSTNPSGYITGITSGMVTTALGFTPLSTTGTAADSDKLDGQHGSYYQPASSAITTSNIGSQSVNYATSAGSASSATNSTNATYATYVNTDTYNAKFHWSEQSGQPTWLWGSNNGSDIYVWNPSNFSVAYASSAGNSDTLDGNHASAFSLTSHNHNGTYLTSVPAATSSTYGGIKVSLSGTTLTITV